MGGVEIGVVVKPPRLQVRQSAPDQQPLIFAGHCDSRDGSARHNPGQHRGILRWYSTIRRRAGAGLPCLWRSHSQWWHLPEAHPEPPCAVPSSWSGCHCGSCNGGLRPLVSAARWRVQQRCGSWHWRDRRQCGSYHWRGLQWCGRVKHACYVMFYSHVEI